MKYRILSLVFFLQTSMLVFAGIVVTKSGESITEVTNIIIDGNFVKYTLHGKEQALPLSEVHAVLYDNGKYEEIKYAVSTQPVNESVENFSGFEVENSSYANSETSFSTNGYNMNQNTVNEWESFFKSDYDNFKTISPKESKSARAAKRKIVLLWGLIKLKQVEKHAMTAYSDAKSRGLSGVDAVRAYNSVYVNAAASKKFFGPSFPKEKKIVPVFPAQPSIPTQSSPSIPTTSPVTSHEDNW